MRALKTMLIILVLGGLAVFLLSCSAESDESAAAENRVVTVQRGNLIIDITAIGNLALSRTEDLAFELAGTVEEVLVEEGDVVEAGQELAKLDTSEWEDNLSVMEDQVTSKERNLLQKEISLRNTEIALEKAMDTYTWPELEVAEADVEKAEARLQYAIDQGYDYLVHTYGALLEAAEKKLDAMLSDVDTDEVAIKKLELELAQGSLEDARKAVEDAQETLEEAKSKSPIIVAPFNGFITKVNIEGGDEVLTGTVAVQLADPEKFEADILVSEMDILQVKMGGEARVQVDAMQGMSLPARITHISPTATIQSGVVNYKVKVEIQPIEAIHQEQQEMMRQRQQEQGHQQAPFSIMPEGYQLREGLTVTVSIMVDERKDVLLVPNKAITRQGQGTHVQVLKDGVIEERSIEAGISDWQFTEVISGLSEGEKVVMPQGTTTTPTTPQQRGGLPFFGRSGGGEAH